MSELLKKQNYGVEVEFTGISRKMAADAVAEIIGTTDSRPDHTCYQTRTIQDSQGRKWKVMRDSSINPIRKVGTENMDEYRVEFVTPVLKYEDLETLQATSASFGFILKSFYRASPFFVIVVGIHDIESQRTGITGTFIFTDIIFLQWINIGVTVIDGWSYVVLHQAFNNCR